MSAGPWVIGVVGVVAMAGLGASASADVALLSQQRSITATTTATGATQTSVAPDFNPFVQTVSVSGTINGVSGPITTSAVSRIDCQINPNAIRATGSLTGAGGIQAATGASGFGDAKAAVLVNFLVSQPTPFSLFAQARPTVNPGDEFILELRNVTLNDRIFRLESSDPAGDVNLSGMLQPGQYSINYRVEITVDGSELTRDYAFALTVPSPAGAIVLVGAGGLLLLRNRPSPAGK